MKKTLALLLALTLMLGAALPALAATDAATRLVYQDNGDGTCTVTGYNRFDETDLAVPKTLGGLTVTSIGPRAFKDKTQLAVVSLPETVTTVGSYAFNGCSGLTSIILGGGVKTVGSYAFNLCRRLTSVNLRNCETVGEFAFYGCTALKSVSGAALKTVGRRAFSSCESLTSLTFPDSLTSIGEYAFADCAALTAVRFPAALTALGDSSFAGCLALESVTFPTYGNLAVGNYAFENCTALKEVTLTPAVVSIGRYAFALRAPKETEFSHDITLNSRGCDAAITYGLLYNVPVYADGVNVSDGYGDANGDGTLTTADARALLNVAAGIEPPYTDQRADLCDMNRNGQIDIGDVSLLLRRIIGV